MRPWSRMPRVQVRVTENSLTRGFFPPLGASFLRSDQGIIFPQLLPYPEHLPVAPSPIYRIHLPHLQGRARGHHHGRHLHDNQGRRLQTRVDDTFYGLYSEEETPHHAESLLCECSRPGQNKGKVLQIHQTLAFFCGAVIGSAGE